MNKKINWRCFKKIFKKRRKISFKNLKKKRLKRSKKVYKKRTNPNLKKTYVKGVICISLGLGLLGLVPIILI